MRDLCMEFRDILNRAEEELKIVSEAHLWCRDGDTPETALEFMECWKNEAILQRDQAALHPDEAHQRIPYAEAIEEFIDDLCRLEAKRKERRCCMVRTYEFELVKKAVIDDSGKLVEGEKVLLPADGAPFPTLRCTGDGSSIRERVLFANHALVEDAGGPTKVKVNVRSF